MLTDIREGEASEDQVTALTAPFDAWSREKGVRSHVDDSRPDRPLSHAPHYHVDELERECEELATSF